MNIFLTFIIYSEKSKIMRQKGVVIRCSTQIQWIQPKHVQQSSLCHKSQHSEFNETDWSMGHN